MQVALRRIYGLVKAFAGCLFDKPAPDKTRHSLADLIGQRIFGIACGHPDCNDGDRLADLRIGTPDRIQARLPAGSRAVRDGEPVQWPDRTVRVGKHHADDGSTSDDDLAATCRPRDELRTARATGYDSSVLKDAPTGQRTLFLVRMPVHGLVDVEHEDLSGVPRRTGEPRWCAKHDEPDCPCSHDPFHRRFKMTNVRSNVNIRT